MKNIQEICDGQGNVLAIIVKREFQGEGIHFFTPDAYSQQLAYMHHKKGHEIIPHVHNKVLREVLYTKEVLVIRSGKMRCDFYGDDRTYIKSAIVRAGDILLLASGGHGFECLEETEMFEIKQGPYSGQQDKTRFEAVEMDKIIVEEYEQ